LFFFSLLFLFPLDYRVRRRFRRLRRRDAGICRVVFFEPDRIFGFGLGPQTVGRLIKRFFGHAEGVHRRRHSAVKDHLGDDLRYLLAGDADVQRPGDVPFDHLRTVAQHHQGRDRAEAAGFQVNSGPVVDLAVNH